VRFVADITWLARGLAVNFKEALGGMAKIPQWFIWRLVWDGAEGKYQKTPCALDGSVYNIDASMSEHWHTFDRAYDVWRALQAQPQCADKQLQYAMGFWMTADCGYFFFDLDKALLDNGTLMPTATALVQLFPGAMVEWSSSKRGMHVFGRTQLPIPPHRSKPKREIKQQLLPLELEFYTDGRGVAFGLDDAANGCADTLHDAQVGALIGEYFPPRLPTDNSERRSEWRGPDDNEELIRRALSARQSAAAAFGGKPSFVQLWQGQAEHGNENDMALAAHLAFWTGCDEDRMERLMRMSGMYREKWDSHRTYLRNLTIANACAGCENVYQEPIRSVAVQHEMYGNPMPDINTVLTTTTTTVVSPELSAKVNTLLDLVSGCGTLEDMHNDVIPAIRAAAIPSALAERLARAVNKQLDIWDSKLPLAKLRHLICPPTIQNSAGNESPEWVQKHCYVKDGDYFLDMSNNSQLTYQGFLAEYGRLMPVRDNGVRENAVDWALNRWGMRTVHRTAYRPDQPSYFEWDGLEFANNYSPATIPVTALEYTEGGLAAIEAMQRHLFDMCGRRPEIYTAVLMWLAHNVQKPGVKVRWAPIIKGCPGDGKSIFGNILRAVMGFRNVNVTGVASLTASGGFTDWATGAAVNVFEEIWIVGRERHRIYNATKEFITNDFISINSKGDKQYNAYNCTNHIAFSNHNDAIPLEDQDRRWLVIFTPWASLVDMLRYCSLDAAGWEARKQAMDRGWKHHGGELRAWLLALPLTGFDKDGSAIETPERAKMIASSKDDAESVAMSIIADGGHGITEAVLSSSCLSNALHIRSMIDKFDLPRGPALNFMLSRMGYSKLTKQVKWRGATHTVWVKNGFTDDNDTVRSLLEASSPRPAELQ
jgi:hypothetical protein